MSRNSHCYFPPIRPAPIDSDETRVGEETAAGWREHAAATKEVHDPVY